MGLDMYAYAQDNPCQPDVDVQPEDPTKEEFAYWRKFNALHRWMENLYVSRGGTKTFNCIDLPLSKEDLKHLERDCIAGTITPTAGFFFGSQEPLETEDYEAITTFITQANEIIEAGRHVFYSSWW